MKTLLPLSRRHVAFAPEGTDPLLAWVWAMPGEKMDRAKYALRLEAKLATLAARMGDAGRATFLRSAADDLLPGIDPRAGPTTVAARVWHETALGMLLRRQMDDVRAWPVLVPREGNVRQDQTPNLVNLLALAEARTSPTSRTT